MSNDVTASPEIDKWWMCKHDPGYKTTRWDKISGSRFLMFDFRGTQFDAYRYDPRFLLFFFWGFLKKFKAEEKALLMAHKLRGWKQDERTDADCVCSHKVCVRGREQRTVKVVGVRSTKFPPVTSDSRLFERTLMRMMQIDLRTCPSYYPGERWCSRDPARALALRTFISETLRCSLLSRQGRVSQGRGWPRVHELQIHLQAMLNGWLAVNKSNIFLLIAEIIFDDACNKMSRGSSFSAAIVYGWRQVTGGGERGFVFVL